MSDFVEYKVDPSSPAVLIGDVVCLSANTAGGPVVKATASALAVGGTVVGIAVSNPIHTPGSMDIVNVVVSGIVPNHITRLGPGRPGAVHVDAGGRPTRIANDVDYLVGCCDNHGNIRVEPIGVIATHNLVGTLNVRAF